MIVINLALRVKSFEKRSNFCENTKKGDMVFFWLIFLVFLFRKLLIAFFKWMNTEISYWYPGWRVSFPGLVLLHYSELVQGARSLILSLIYAIFAFVRLLVWWRANYSTNSLHFSQTPAALPSSRSTSCTLRGCSTHPTISLLVVPTEIGNSRQQPWVFTTHFVVIVAVITIATTVIVAIVESIIGVDRYP